MNFLLYEGVDKKVVDYLEETYSEQEKNIILLASEKICSSIRYLREIGVTKNTIDEILYEDYSVLLPGVNKLMKSVSRLNKEKFVESLNTDLKFLDLLKFD